MRRAGRTADGHRAAGQGRADPTHGGVAEPGPVRRPRLLRVHRQSRVPGRAHRDRVHVSLRLCLRRAAGRLPLRLWRKAIFAMRAQRPERKDGAAAPGAELRPRRHWATACLRRGADPCTLHRSSAGHVLRLLGSERQRCPCRVPHAAPVANRGCVQPHRAVRGRKRRGMLRGLLRSDADTHSFGLRKVHRSRQQLRRHSPGASLQDLRASLKVRRAAAP